MARILIVDDDPQAIDRLQQLLGDEHELASTGDWTQVSRLFFQRPCDLVLMDVNLPGLKGDQLIEILRRMPTRPETRPTRLVFFTSSDEDEARALAERCQADGYLLKSTRNLRLLEQIEAYLL